mmetsp:Transcript_202/g.497  ORF Transcript_202/g.497 Transcript_202/m.497 type:complete len:225 (+) Transcript_202:1874-2548(+)
MDNDRALRGVQHGVGLLVDVLRQLSVPEGDPSIVTGQQVHRLRLGVFQLGNENEAVGDEEFVAVPDQAVQVPAAVVGVSEVHVVRPDVQLLLIPLLAAQVGQVDPVLLLLIGVPPTKLHHIGCHQGECPAQVLGDIQFVGAGTELVGRLVVTVGQLLRAGRSSLARRGPCREQGPLRTRLVKDKCVDLGALPHAPPRCPPVAGDEVDPRLPAHQDSVLVRRALR